MKLINKITLIIFSTIMLVLSFLACFVIFGWLDLEVIYKILKSGIQNSLYSNITLCISLIFILLSIKSIFFGSKSENDMEPRDGILLENIDGKLLITRETLENLTNGVVEGFDSAENVITKVTFNRENQVLIYLTLQIKENAIIKELSNNLQTKIKETIKNTTDLEVKEVNIKVKDIETKKNLVQN